MTVPQGILNILIVDDETNIRKTLSYCLETEGHSVVSVANSLEALKEAKRRPFDIAFIDLRLENENGMDLIPPLLAESPWLKVVAITANATIETAVEAMRRGAADYIEKPFTSAQVRLLTRTLGHIRDLENEITVLKEDRRRFAPESLLQSNNPKMQRIIETLHKAAASEAIILLRGESGTGKSVFARTIHNCSPRAKKPIMIVSCPAVPSELLESELFGHAKGAFTGAVRENPGRIAACEGGTLFLDEIGDMALPIQAKLLRFIQDKEYERLGETMSRKANVRILTATNVNLEKRVAEGLFREDLFYRINVISVHVLPLRERREDIMTIADDFCRYFCRTNNKTIIGFDASAEQALRTYSWPGNVRELRNAIERAVILGNGDFITGSDLPESIVPSMSSPGVGDPVTLSTLEEFHIKRILQKTSSIQEAAAILGIDQATLWRRRKTYGI
ncbi:sigma-54-dependent transcriptional regulator [Desulfopila aestuarii]|uniref:Two-component response regulator AlgB n=1 Tax=Desulfopila aestuarii DSM 18488 TaxID=1121416 RepID=A0A1M7YKA1_9BACT|nr:sigma-54 dependent transcriptional regulator [Desulfopila aestuarii]SHO53044.1 Two-component response regulator AlgB [Desulfopila aestuarii DSM 18488]